MDFPQGACKLPGVKLQASTDTDIYRPVPKLFKYRYQYRWPIFIKTIGLCFYIVVEDGV